MLKVIDFSAKLTRLILFFFLIELKPVVHVSNASYRIFYVTRIRI